MAPELSSEHPATTAAPQDHRPTAVATSPPPEEPQHIPPPPHATAAQLSPPLREAWLPPNHEGEASVRSSHEGEAAGPSSHEEQPEKQLPLPKDREKQLPLPKDREKQLPLPKDREKQLLLPHGRENHLPLLNEREKQLIPNEREKQLPPPKERGRRPNRPTARSARAPTQRLLQRESGQEGEEGHGLERQSGGRAITRGVVPAINAELELLTSDAPTIVTNPALTGAAPRPWGSRSEERTESQWEEALHLLDGHALPHYILVDWWGTIDRCLCDAAAARSFAEEGEGASRLGEAEGLAAQWHAALRELLLRLRRQGEAEDVSFDALLLLLRQGFEAHRAEVERCTPLRGRTKPELQRSNLAHQAAAIAARVQAELERAYSKQCVRLARALKLDSSAVEGGKALRRKLEQVMRLGEYRDYALMTKLAYNELVGQKRLWAAGEREALLCSLCTRNDAHGAPRVWITKDFFFQHTDQNAGEVHVLVYLPRMEIQALIAVADFQPPWTAGQFHHMAHACQEDRMFFLGRKSERDFAPKVTYDMSNSFEGGSRWTSHFHMPTLLAVDIICAKPGVRGLGLLLLAHVCCLQSSFTNTRTHILFDISGRESNVRMIRFTQSVGAQRCQTFADEARSTGFIGVEGDDPRIFWTHKAGSSYGPNDGKTSGVYAVDVETNEAIGPSHPAVLFDDRVTQHDFYRGGRNCSYFAVSPIEVAQAKLTGLLEEMRVRLEAGAAQQWSAQSHSTAPA
ncbi:hypothetical protein AB1Y20_020715 [Prymnesium parvum]|uniref:Uncharacterized protein n=1 Tax=Prymnesium parvum TaxID=97485 RepID=A0AB34JYF4_PRYPA